MCSITQGVKNGGNLHGHILVNANHVGLRDGKILCKATGAVNTHPHGVGAQVEHATAAVAAVAADNMALAGNNLTRLVLCHGRTYALDNTAELMPHVHADGYRLLSPSIPVPDMQIRTANSCAVNLNKNIVGADFRHRHLHQFESFISFCFNESFHGRKYYSSSSCLASLILFISGFFCFR